MSTEAPNEIIHQSMRLKIMATLHADRSGEPVEFVQLKSLTGATDGNLGTHLATLEKAGYITVTKDFVGRKPRTRISITKPGRRAFERHVAYLRETLDGN